MTTIRDSSEQAGGMSGVTTQDRDLACPQAPFVVIVVPGVALTERKRQRFLPGRGSVGARTDTPDRKDFKARVAFCARQVCQEPFRGPIAVSFTIRRPRPDSWPKRPTKANPWPWAWWKKPDADNFVKCISDALKGIAWLDDAQIVDLHVHKHFGPRHEVVISVARATEHYISGCGSEVRAVE